MNTPVVLVAYESRNGGTAEIAQWIGEELTAAGVEAEVRPAAVVQELRGYSGVGAVTSATATGSTPGPGRSRPMSRPGRSGSDQESRRSVPCSPHRARSVRS